MFIYKKKYFQAAYQGEHVYRAHVRDKRVYAYLNVYIHTYINAYTHTYNTHGNIIPNRIYVKLFNL